MIAPDQSFSQVLEQYTLKVADLFIESTDQETQSLLIQLISRIDTTSGPAKKHTELLPVNETKSEWQQVLDAPVDWLSVGNHRLISQIRSQLKRNELYMTNLRQAILTIEQRYQRTQNTIASEPHRTSLLDRHRRTQACFQQQLELANREHQFYLNQLSHLEQSEVNRKAYR